MTDDHPITPPPELVDKWVAMLEYCEDIDVFTDVARWGADQELEACRSWLRHEDVGACGLTADWMYEARRPKPPSLKEQALALLDDASDRLDAVHENTIRRALEALPE